MQSVRYLIFDVKSFADAQLVARVHFPEDESLVASPLEAVHRWKTELMEKNGSDFIPYTFHIPTAIVLAKVSEKYELLDIASLSEVRMKPEEIVERFWRGWERYGRPTLVTFNGRTYDVPLLELSAFRYGIPIPGWFSPVGKNYDQLRTHFNQAAHIDLQDLFTNFGTTRFTGGLNLAANILGKPGKMEIQDAMVQEMHEAGKFQEIENHCIGDVLNTYFVFLRARVLTGYLPPSGEQKLVNTARQWLEERVETCEAYKEYLEKWEI